MLGADWSKAKSDLANLHDTREKTLTLDKLTFWQDVF